MDIGQCCQLHEYRFVLKLPVRRTEHRRSILFQHGVCMLRECIYGECAHEQHIRRTLTLTDTITAYSVCGNVRVRILICATRQKPRRKRVYHRRQCSEE